MAKKPETKFYERVKSKLDTLPYSWWTKTQQVAIRGTPDILGCVRGYFVAIELKASQKEAPNPLQQYNLKQIKKAGSFALVVCPENWLETWRMLVELAAFK